MNIQDINTNTVEGMLLMTAISKLRDVSANRGISPEGILDALVSKTRANNLLRWTEITGEVLPDAQAESVIKNNQ